MNKYITSMVHLPVSPDRWCRHLFPSLNVPWSLAQQDQQKKVGRDNQYFPGLVWELTGFPLRAGEISKHKSDAPACRQNSMGAAKPPRIKTGCKKASRPCTLSHPCSRLPAPLAPSAPSFLSDPRLSDLPHHRAFTQDVFSPIPTLLCPDKSHGFQPSIPTAKEPSLTQFPSWNLSFHSRFITYQC